MYFHLTANISRGRQFYPKISQQTRCSGVIARADKVILFNPSHASVIHSQLNP
jgi:hypothetical protein